MKKFILLFMSLFLITSCLQTRNDIKETETTQNLQNQLSVMHKNNADYVSRVEESLESNRQLNGRLEVVENKLNKLENSENQKKSDEVRQILELNQKVNLMQEALSKMENDMQSFRSELVAVKSIPIANGKSSINGSPSGGEVHKHIFETAENLFKEKKWKEAILQYDEYRKKNSKGKLVPEATYKTGVCFQELGMKEEAKTFYQEVIAKFSKSDMARRAHTRLKGM